MIRSTLRRAVVLTATIAIVLPLTSAAQAVPSEQLSALTYRHRARTTWAPPREVCGRPKMVV